ncbi:MAG: D-alanyl-D-alanine carboxypeptidase [Alphaproteobacteria bacterium]|nr:D-alanyl-D-alanine carboxypeptidase [Alphaproteobacteria bacterium]
MRDLKGSTVFQPRIYSALLGICICLLASSLTAQTIETAARHAVLYDLTTDTILLDKASDVPMPPASMSKLMTVYMVFERLKAGRLSLDDKFVVSRKAWRKGGSKMFVMVKSRVTVKDLLRGIIIQSGNDACIVIAEGISGTEEAFAEAMTQKAKEIGLKNSAFKNATGWPADGHYMSARDIATLSKKLIIDFPEYYKIFSETEFSHGGIKQGNRNPLLYKGFGADGLKTGHTEASGYGLAASAVRKDRRLLLVVNGLQSKRARASESARLLDWAFRETASYALFKKHDVIEKADVWLGNASSLLLVVDRNLTLTMSRKARHGMKVKVTYDNPIPAPVKKGTQVGLVTVTAPGLVPIVVPLVANANVEQLGAMGRLNAAINYLLFGGS